MSSINQVTLIGRLTADATVATKGMFTLAVDEGKDKDGKDRLADFVPIHCGNEKLIPYLKKGKLIAVSGYVHTYKDKNNMTKVVIGMRQVQFLEKKEAGESESAEATPTNGETPWE